MPFMYLQLHIARQDEEPGDDESPRRQAIFGDGLWATVTNEGQTPKPPHAVGSSNGRYGGDPVAVFRISGFDGLTCIDEDDLLEELLRRQTIDQLMTRLEWTITKERLIELLQDRLGVIPAPQTRRSWADE